MPTALLLVATSRTLDSMTLPFLRYACSHTWYRVSGRRLLSITAVEDVKVLDQKKFIKAV